MSKPARFDWLFRPHLADEDLPLAAEARFAEALAELPAVERSALALSEIGGLDTHEIAERLGTDPAIVVKLLARARTSVRASLAVGGRRGLTALLPFHSWWQTGSAAPAVRAAGVVAAAVVGSSLAIGGAAAEAPRATLTSPDPPRVRALEQSDPGAITAQRAGVSAATAAAAVTATRREEAAAPRERRSVRSGPGLRRDRNAAAAAPAQQPLLREQAEPAAERETPAPSPPAEPATVAETVPLIVTLDPPPAPPVELPVVPPPLPAVPPVVPELPQLPPPPLP